MESQSYEDKFYVIPDKNLKFNIRKINDPKDYFEIFTDGSKTDDKVDCSFIMFDDIKKVYYEKYRLNNEFSVYITELTAIDKAVDHVINNLK